MLTLEAEKIIDAAQEVESTIFNIPGESSPLLQTVSAPTGELTTGLWLLTHPDLVRSARVNAFMDHFGEALAEDSVNRV